MIPAEPSPHLELPRLSLWQRLPTWLRIAMGVGAAVIVGNVLLAARIWYGLQLTPEIKAARKAGCYLELVENLPDIYWLPETWRPSARRIMLGLRGRSNRDVIRLHHNGGTDVDRLLKVVTQNFSSLEELRLQRSDVTAAGLQSITQLANLERLFLDETDLDSSIGPTIASCKNLREVYLNLTLVDDTLFDHFSPSDNSVLRRINVTFTGVSDDAVTRAREVLPWTKIMNNAPSMPIQSVRIRWRDGRQGCVAPRDAVVRVAQLDDAGHEMELPHARRGLLIHFLAEKPFGSQPMPGRYRLKLALGGSHPGIESLPVEITLRNGQADPDRIEFVMPCTKEEALRSAE